MLRMESETGWWLIRHPEYAELAGSFAAAWNARCSHKPEPRERVLHGIARHDDSWATRDAQPVITRQGKALGFSTEARRQILCLPGRSTSRTTSRCAIAPSASSPKTTLCRSVDLDAHLQSVDGACVRFSAPEGLALLDAFLERLRVYQAELRASTPI